jgi:hypothetical protein
VNLEAGQPEQTAQGPRVARARVRPGA